MDYPIQPLYRLLQYWHLYASLTRISSIAEKSKKVTLTANHTLHLEALGKQADFEKSLLKVHGSDFDPNAFIGVGDRSKFDWHKEKSAAELDLHWTTISIPAMIASWTQQSRRVYTIPEDLQLLLASTSLQGVDWQKVRFPFESFLLNLPVPIEDDKGVSYDAMLVSRDSPKWGNMVNEAWGERFESSPILSVTIIPARLKSAATDLPIAKQQQLLRQAQGAGPVKAHNAVGAILYGGKQMIPRTKLVFPLEVFQHQEFVEMIEAREGGGVSATGAEFSGKARELNRLVGRILFGFILYLQNTPKSSTLADRSEPHHPSRIPGQGKVLADVAQVCHVQSIYKLDAEEKTVFRNVMMGKGGYEVSTHHREGHWRRPPGKGHDSTVEKTVWVRPTIVRRDSLQEGTLPKGTEKIVA